MYRAHLLKIFLANAKAPLLPVTFERPTEGMTPECFRQGHVFMALKSAIADYWEQCLLAFTNNEN